MTINHKHLQGQPRVNKLMCILCSISLSGGESVQIRKF